MVKEFGEDNFRKIFPFFVCIDKQLNIVSAGPSIQKMIGSITNRPFEEVFKFVRPSLSIEMSYESMMSHLDVVIIIESIEFPLLTRFRGQFIYQEKEDIIVYLNSPWITDVVDLGFHNLLISDFAIHDTITDNLQLLQSKQIVNDDIRRIADELRSQRDELVDKTKTIEDLAEFPEQNPHPILRIDNRGEVLYANKPAQKLFEEETTVKDSLWETIKSQLFDSQEKYLARELNYGAESYLATIVPIPDKRYYNIYINNTTETVKYHNELINTSSRLYSLINNMNAAVLAEDENRKIILVNQMFCDLFQVPLTAEQMTGEDCSGAAEQSKHFFKDEEGFVSRIEEVLSNRVPVFGDLLYLKSERILERDFVPVFEDKLYKGHIWKYQDITEIVKNKESLGKVEEKYRKIIENLKLGLIEVDLDEKITKVYPAFCEMTGYTEEELINRNARKLLGFVEEDKKLEEQNILRKNGESGVYETMVRTKNGEAKWLIISGAPIYNEKNEIVGSLGIHVDISERKKLEEELILAKDIAVSSVKAKEVFIANMSHEIRTPMNVIIGMTELLYDSLLDKEQRKYLSAVKTSADNLLGLINDILDFSKIEAGHLEMEELKLNLRSVFDNLEVSFEPKAREKNIQIKTEIDTELSLNLLGDGYKLNQVLVNLISNAIKFTEQGNVCIKADLIENGNEFQKIKFAVIDSGIGINPENLEAIFQMFKQEDSSITRRYGGTGLGLSISQSIVENMGGKIDVKSEKQVGSEFSFIIDLKKELVKEQISVSDPIIQVNFGDELKILVAEDNELNQLLITTILKQGGFHYDAADDGKVVLEMLGKQDYHLILMDIQMPYLDGMATAKFIREEMKSNIPIIALTANASAADEAKYKAAGMNDYIAKPFKKDELFAKIFLQLKNKVMNDINETTTHDENSEGLYSLKNIEAISQGDTQFVNTIIDTFITNTPNYLEEIVKGIQLEDFAKIKYASHQMKPSLDILEIDSVRQTVRDIETESSSANQSIDKIKNDFDHLYTVVNQVIRHMVKNSSDR
jgi:PAS domain S-box-containing protein